VLIVEKMNKRRQAFEQKVYLTIKLHVLAQLASV
jgi:hypothetical protein